MQASAKAGVRGSDLGSETVWRAAAAALLVVGLAARLRDYSSAPLWLDEAWTGAIVAAPDFRALWPQLLADVNAPLFPLVEHAWTRFAGLSNEALRAPPLLFALAAPLLCLWRGAPLADSTRLAWAVAVALFPMAVAYAQEARSYGLLFLLAVAMTIAHLRLLASPTLPRACVWVGLGALASLAHYHGGLLLAGQGVALMAMHPRALLRLSPAALLALPVVAWFSLHAATVFRYMDPVYAWYPLLDVGPLSLMITLTLAALIVVFAVAARRPEARIVAATVLPACVCGFVIIVSGFFRPSFTWRYMLAFYPGVLLGLAFLLTVQIRDRRIAAALAFPVVLLMTLAAWGTHPIQKQLNFQSASAWLMERAPQRLVFLWDNPTAGAVADQQLALLGSFFFLRAGAPIETQALKVRAGEDANLALLAQADADALLWIYDHVVPGTSAKVHPPRLEALGARFECRQFGERSIGVLACRKPQ